jgi:hypothetical protein
VQINAEVVRQNTESFASFDQQASEKKHLNKTLKQNYLSRTKGRHMPSDFRRELHSLWSYCCNLHPENKKRLDMLSQNQRRLDDEVP